MTVEPTLLLVHGAWGGGWNWDPMLEPLHERGVHVDVIERLPSAGTDPAKLGDLASDAEHVRARLDDSSGPVVLCGFSYGGMVITEVADHTAISHSIYLAAFWPPEGKSLLDLALAGGETLPSWIVDCADGSLAITDDLEVARQALAGDLSPDDAASIQEQCVFQSAAAFAAPSSAPPRTHPVTYVLCTEDEAIPTPAQEAMSTAADSTIRIQSAHMVQFSCTEELADALAGVVVGGHSGAPAA
jgi:pimeloyl-ACP methyl ester carboxylesterase